MNHDFDAVIKGLALRKEWRECMTEQEEAAVKFALRFTKAALSGEVSEGVENSGCDEFLANWPWLRTEIDTGAYGVMPPEPLNAAFKAMAAQLAKEIEQ